MKTRFAALLLAALTLFSLAGCGGGSSAQTQTPAVDGGTLLQVMMEADDSLPEMTTVAIDAGSLSSNTADYRDRKKTFSYISDLPFDLVDRFAVAYSVDGQKADEIAVIAVKDEADAGDALDSLGSAAESGIRAFGDRLIGLLDSVDLETGLQSLVITDGKVLVSGHNPQTGETKTVEVCGGQQVSCFLYDDITEERTSIEFELKDLDESELPEFPLQMLAENPELMEKVCAETGWDKDELLDLVNAILDPNTPSPTPDAIIEITDTPTAAPTATEAPLLLITPTTSPTPMPKPTNPLSVINNVINDMIPDPTGTPEPSIWTPMRIPSMR